MSQKITDIKRIFLFGFSRWKHDYIKPFLAEYSDAKICFINPIFASEYGLACRKGLKKYADVEIFIWGCKEFAEVQEFARANNIKITRVEDGFIRSVALGSDLTQPYSQVFDDIGIYFDATCPSKLENILNYHNFDKRLLQQADTLITKLINSKLSKYNKDVHRELNLPSNMRKILVPGQVENDASIKFGGRGMTNLELLKKVRQAKPDEYIIYKPHPDVLSGNRLGDVLEEQVLQYCDEIITDISMASVLCVVDEVHTITSLTGFEGLLYGKDVYTYGMPFYAGWGLTNDALVESRRQRKLSLTEVVAAAYIIYPSYIHPNTLKPCSVIELINELIKLQQSPAPKYNTKLRAAYAGVMLYLQRVLKNK